MTVRLQGSQFGIIQGPFRGVKKCVKAGLHVEKGYSPETLLLGSMYPDNEALGYLKPQYLGTCTLRDRFSEQRHRGYHGRGIKWEL